MYPKVCSFKGRDPIVCCFDSTNTTKPEGPRPIFLSINTTDSEEVKKVEQEKKDEETRVPLAEKIGGEDTECPPIPDKFVIDPEEPDVLGNVSTTKKTGQKAWDKCIEYQQNLIFPCVRNNMTKQLERIHKCAKIEFEVNVALGSNGKSANLNEFAHMALLGYGKDLVSSEWLCGGTIISEKFILTAGHCVYSVKFGNVTRVATGFLKRSDIPKRARIYNVKNVVTHSEYKPPSKYNDIALLEIEGMRIDEYNVPACLYTDQHTYKNRHALATGWGALWYKGDRPDVLQKMFLTEFSTESCYRKFPGNRLLKFGYNETTQLCYGDPLKNTDTCDGDSGGPLQYRHPDMHCMHLIIGVTSFGSHCGVVNQPAVYTRVLPYVPWIESVVWPDEINAS